MRTVFIEAGGHIGEQIDDVLKKHPDWEIISIEPNPDLAFDLNVKYINEPKVKILNMALWVKSDVTLFHVAACTFGSSLYDKDQKKDMLTSHNSAVIIRSIDIIELLEKFADVEIALYLELDCEGAEYAIIEKLITTGMYKKISKWCVEFHHIEGIGREKRKEAILDFLKSKDVKWFLKGHI